MRKRGVEWKFVVSFEDFWLYLMQERLMTA